MAEKYKSIDPLLDRTATPDYNCLDFVREAWSYLFGGENIDRKLSSLSDGVHSSDGRVILSAIRGFRKLSRPVAPCFVVMQRTKLQPHIGIFHKGRILHLKETGVEFQPLHVARRYFTRIGFYAE